MKRKYVINDDYVIIKRIIFSFQFTFTIVPNPMNGIIVTPQFCGYTTLFNELWLAG